MAELLFFVISLSAEDWKPDDADVDVAVDRQVEREEAQQTAFVFLDDPAIPSDCYDGYRQDDDSDDTKAHSYFHTYFPHTLWSTWLHLHQFRLICSWKWTKTCQESSIRTIWIYLKVPAVVDNEHLCFLEIHTVNAFLLVIELSVIKKISTKMSYRAMFICQYSHLLFPSTFTPSALLRTSCRLPDYRYWDSSWQDQHWPIPWHCQRDRCRSDFLKQQNI